MAVPESKNTPIKFGIAMRPLNVSAMLQRSPRSTVAPMIATNEYAIINGRIIFAENKNSMQRAP